MVSIQDSHKYNQCVLPGLYHIYIAYYKIVWLLQVTDFNTEIGESKSYILTWLMNEGQPILSNNIASYYKAKFWGKMFTSIKYTIEKKPHNFIF